MFAKGDNYSAAKRAQSSQGGNRNEIGSASSTKKEALNLFKSKKTSFGLDIAELKRWSQERTEQELGQESSKQEIAVSKVKGFLDAIATAVYVQSWWRMIRIRREYNRIMNERKYLKRRCYRSWKIYWKSERLYLFHVLGKFFEAWRDEIKDEKRLKKTIAGFFAICIKRMKLTPQAIMAFFNPGEWSHMIAHEDRMKIRRMVLLKLFNGWKNESHDLKIMRYKASQILSRMVRRTKGPLWVKESTLVCFHMWYRYTVVKNSYRRGELDPNFKNPYLPQWTKLYKEITLSRVKKKRTLETGQLLTQRRAYGKWRYLMTVDRSKPVTPLAVAINHYNTVLSTKVLIAWYRYVRDRGRAMRYAEKIFYAWQQWAPKHRKLRLFNDIATEWVRLQRVRRSFKVMTKICQTMISIRTEKIKELRKIFCDRRIVLCAYALLNKNEHVMMVDCWRKLVCYWKGRRRWKALNWHFNYSWFAHKAKEILHAWRVAAVVRREARLRGDAPDDVSVESYLTSVDHQSLGGDSTLDALFAHLSGKDGSNQKSVMSDFWDEGNRLFYAARYDQQVLKPGEKEFLFLCLMWSKYWNQIQQFSSMTSEDFSRKILHDPKFSGEMMNQVKDGGSFIPKSMMPLLDSSSINTGGSSIASTAATYLNPGNQDNFNHVGLGVKLPYNHLYKELWNKDRQDKFQKAVDYAELPTVLNVLNEMPIYESKFMKQLLGHLGDHYIPLFALMLMGSVCFLAERMIKKDKNAILLQVHSPINAFVLGSHLARWEKIDLTTREVTKLSQEDMITDMNCSCFRSVMMWRLLFLHFLDNRCIKMASTCRTLPVTRSMETEVAEVLKRNKVVKMFQLQRSVSAALGFELEWTVESRSASLIPPLVFEETRKTIIVNPNDDEDERPATGGVKKNIYYVLREYLLLTGKLAKEAKALRDPLMERDQKLIVSGFLKQARKDYLALRRECMTKKEIEAEQEKKEREREKQLRNERKAEAKARARRKAAKIKKKKDAKALKASLSESAKTNTSFGPGDTGDLEGGDEEGGGEGADGAETGGDTANEGGADTDNNMQSPAEGGMTSFDEKDFDKLRSTIIRELFDELSLVEESEIFEERDFQERVAEIESPVYIETWIPYAWIHDSEVRKNYEIKLKRELRLALKRVFFVMQHQDAFGPFNYQIVRSQFQGVGMFMIDTVLGDNTPTQPYRNSPLWLVLPKDYWSFRQVKERIFHEQAFIEGLVNGMKERLGQVEEANENIDNNISKYQKYLKKVRKQVVDIAQKQVEKEADDEMEKAAKIQLIKKTEKSIASTHRKINAINEKVRLTDMMIAGGNFEGVYELLRPPPELDENGNPIVKKKDEPHTTASIMQMVEDVKGKAQDLAKNIKDLEEKKHKMELELKAYSMYCMRATKLLKNLAEDRFNTMIDLQLLTNRISKNLDNAEVEELEMKKFRKFNNKYLRAIQHFFDENVSNRGMQLTKDAELKKIQELMNRPTFGAAATVSAPNAATTTSTLRIGTEIRRTHSLEEKVPPSPAAQQRSLSSKHIKSDPVVPSRRRSGTMASFHLEDSPEPDLIPEGEDEIALAPELLPTKQEPLRGASTVSYDNTESSVASSAAQRLARQINDQMQGSFIEPEEEEDDPLVELPLTSKVEAVPINRTLTIDEEIELLHYNSPEMIAKREEELRQLAIQKAEELANQELRMKIFDDYWLAYPRKEVAPDYSIKKKDKPAPKAAPVPEYIEPAKRVIRTRSERMWQSVGEGYWRAKREYIEHLIRAQGDFSGLDPESIATVIMQKKDSIDPLDHEFDLLPDIVEEDEEDEEPKFKTLVQQLIEPFNEMESEIWKSPVRATPAHGPGQGGQGQGQSQDQSQSMSLSISMKKLPKFPMKTGEMPVTNIATALFNPDTAFSNEGPPLSNDPSALNRDMVTPQEVALLGEDPPRQKGSRDKAKAKPDPFALAGSAEFKRIREGLTGRGLRSVNMDDDEFSVSVRTGGSSAGYITLEDRSDSSTFYQLKAETIIAKKKALKMNAMNGGHNAILSPIKSVPASPGSRAGSNSVSRDGSVRKSLSQQGSVRSRFDDEEYEGDGEGGEDDQGEEDMQESEEEDGDDHSDNSSISSHQMSANGTHSSSVEHRRQVAEYLDLINDKEGEVTTDGLEQPAEYKPVPTSEADSHMTDAQKRSQKFREFKEKRSKRQTFAATTGSDLLKATMLLTQQKDKQQQQIEDFKKNMMNKSHQTKNQSIASFNKRRKRRNSTMSTGTEVSEDTSVKSKRSTNKPTATAAPANLTRTASAELIAIARSRHSSEENSLVYSLPTVPSGSASYNSESHGGHSISRADSEVMSIGSSMQKSLQKSVRYLEENDDMLKPPGTFVPFQPQQLPPPEDLTFDGHQFVAVRAKDGTWSLVPSATLPVPFIKDRSSPTHLYASSVLGGIPVDGGPLVLEGKSVFQPITLTEADLESLGSQSLDPEILKNFRLIHTLGLPEKMSDSILSVGGNGDSASEINLMELVQDFKEKQDAARLEKEEAELRARFSPTKDQQIAAILKQYQQPITFVPPYFRQNKPEPEAPAKAPIKFSDDMISGDPSRDVSPTHSRAGSLDGDEMLDGLQPNSDGRSGSQKLLRIVGEHIDVPSPTPSNNSKFSSPPYMSPALTMRVSIPTPKLLEERLIEADNNAILNSKVSVEPEIVEEHSGVTKESHQRMGNSEPASGKKNSREKSATPPVVPKLFRQFSDTYSEGTDISDLQPDDITIAAAQPISDLAVRDMAQQLRDYIKSREQVMKERQILQQQAHNPKYGSPGKLRTKESMAHERRNAEDQLKNHYSERLPRSPPSPLHPFPNSSSSSPNSTKRRLSQGLHGGSSVLSHQSAHKSYQPRVMFESAVTWFEPAAGHGDELGDLDDVNHGYDQHPPSKNEVVLVKNSGRSADFWIDVSKASRLSQDNIGTSHLHTGSAGPSNSVAMVIPNTPLHIQQHQEQIFPSSAPVDEKPRRSLKEDREERSLGPRVVLKAKKLNHPHNEYIPEDRFLAGYKRVSRITNRGLGDTDIRQPSELDPYEIATRELQHELIQGVSKPIVDAPLPGTANNMSRPLNTARSDDTDDDHSTGLSVTSASGIPMIPLALHQHRQQSPPALHHPKVSGRYGGAGTPTAASANSARSNSAAALQIINEIAGEQYHIGDSAIPVLGPMLSPTGNNPSSHSAASVLSTSSAANVAPSGVSIAKVDHGPSSHHSFGDIPLVVTHDGGSLASFASSSISPKRSTYSITSSVEFAGLTAPQLIPSAPSNYHLVLDNQQSGQHQESPWVTGGNGAGKDKHDVAGLMVVATPARVLTKPSAAIAAVVASASTPALPIAQVSPGAPAPSTTSKVPKSSAPISNKIGKTEKKKENKSVEDNFPSNRSSKQPPSASANSSMVAKKLEDQIELSRLTSPYIDPTLLVNTPRAKTPHTGRAESMLDQALALNSVPISPYDQDHKDNYAYVDEASIEQHIKVRVNRLDDIDSQRESIMDDESYGDEDDDEDFEDDLDDELRGMLRSESAPASLTPAAASFSSLKQMVAATKRLQQGKSAIKPSPSAPQLPTSPSSNVGKAQFPAKLETGVKIPGHNPQSGFVPNQSNASKNPFHGVKRKKQLQLPPLLSPAPVALSSSQPTPSSASTMPTSAIKSSTDSGFVVAKQKNVELSSSMPISKITPQIKGKEGRTVVPNNSQSEGTSKKVVDPSLRGAREAYLQMMQHINLPSDNQSVSSDSKLTAPSVKMERKGSNIVAGMPTF